MLTLKRLARGLGCSFGRALSNRSPTLREPKTSAVESGGSEMVHKKKWREAIERCSTDGSPRLSARPRKGKWLLSAAN